MVQTRDEIRDVVVGSIREMLQGRGLFPIDDQTAPVRDLPLESIDGIDFACIVRERLGCEIPAHLNPFVADSPRRARTVGEITDFIADLIGGSRG